MERKFNEHSWALRNLKRSGFKRDDLLMSYFALIRPIFDFTAVLGIPPITVLGELAPVGAPAEESFENY